MPRTVELDLTDVRVLLLEATKILDETDEMEVKADFKDGVTRSQNPEAATAQRNLLRLRDILTAAAGETGMIWWSLKAYADPRFEPADQ